MPWAHSNRRAWPADRRFPSRLARAPGLRRTWPVTRAGAPCSARAPKQPAAGTDSVKAGIDAAQAELADVSVTWLGPTQDQVERQIALLEALIPRPPSS
jgi:hypothetical protein